MAKRGRPRVVLRLRPGQRHASGELAPEISFHPQGRQTYLWVGGRGCFGHISGAKKLEKFARALLDEVTRRPTNFDGMTPPSTHARDVANLERVLEEGKRLKPPRRRAS